MYEQIGITIAVVCISMIAIVALAKTITTTIARLKAKKKRREVELSPPRRHIMSNEERNVARALHNINKKRGIKDG